MVGAQQRRFENVHQLAGFPLLRSLLFLELGSNFIQAAIQVSSLFDGSCEPGLCQGEVFVELLGAPLLTFELLERLARQRVRPFLLFDEIGRLLGCLAAFDVERVLSVLDLCLDVGELSLQAAHPLSGRVELRRPLGEPLAHAFELLESGIRSISFVLELDRLLVDKGVRFVEVGESSLEPLADVTVLLPELCALLLELLPVPFALTLELRLDAGESLLCRFEDGPQLARTFLLLLELLARFLSDPLRLLQVQRQIGGVDTAFGAFDLERGPSLLENGHNVLVHGFEIGESLFGITARLFRCTSSFVRSLLDDVEILDCVVSPLRLRDELVGELLGPFGGLLGLLQRLGDSAIRLFADLIELGRGLAAALLQPFNILRELSRSSSLGLQVGLQLLEASLFVGELFERLLLVFFGLGKLRSELGRLIAAAALGRVELVSCVLSSSPGVVSIRLSITHRLLQGFELLLQLPDHNLGGRALRRPLALVFRHGTLERLQFLLLRLQLLLRLLAFSLDFRDSVPFPVHQRLELGGSLPLGIDFALHFGGSPLEGVHFVEQLGYLGRRNRLFELGHRLIISDGAWPEPIAYPAHMTHPALVPLFPLAQTPLEEPEGKIQQLCRTDGRVFSHVDPIFL